MSTVVTAPCNQSDRDFLLSFRLAPPRLIDSLLATLPSDALPEAIGERQRWLLCALLQQTVDIRHIDAMAWANDERFESFLDACVAGDLPADLHELGPRLKYMPGNRAQKHSRRGRLLERYCNDFRRTTPSPATRAELADDVAWVKKRTTDREFRLLGRAAVEPLEEIAKSEGLPLGTLKSLLSRCRARLLAAS
jgi:hypothetical protein